MEQIATPDNKDVQVQVDKNDNRTFNTSVLYECWGGGPIVRDPKDCHKMDRRLVPELRIDS